MSDEKILYAHVGTTPGFESNDVRVKNIQNETWLCMTLKGLEWLPDHRLAIVFKSHRDIPEINGFRVSADPKVFHDTYFKALGVEFGGKFYVYFKTWGFLLELRSKGIVVTNNPLESSTPYCYETLDEAKKFIASKCNKGLFN